MSTTRTLNPPSKWLAAAELPRAIAETGMFAAALPTLMAVLPRGDAHPVLVLPGLLASDSSTAPLRAALQGLGYDARGWSLGRNLGERAAGREGAKLISTVERIADETGRRVSLIGWSLGGIFARLVAARRPRAIRQLITLGSPFAGSPKSTNAWRIFERFSGERAENARTKAIMREIGGPPAIPSTAIYSRTDGICAWQNCRDEDSPQTESVEDPGSHCGLGMNPIVLHAIADRLAQPEGRWKPFKPHGLATWFYPLNSGQTA